MCRQEVFLKPQLATICNLMTNTKTKCFKCPMYAIFVKSKGFKNIKYGISSKIFNTNFLPNTFHLFIKHKTNFQQNVQLHGA